MEGTKHASKLQECINIGKKELKYLNSNIFLRTRMYEGMQEKKKESKMAKSQASKFQEYLLRRKVKKASKHTAKILATKEQQTMQVKSKNASTLEGKKG